MKNTIEAAVLQIIDEIGKDWRPCDDDSGRECRGLRCRWSEHRAAYMAMKLLARLRHKK